MAAFNFDGKVVSVNDQVSIVGNVVSVAGTGSLAVITVETVLTPNTFVAQANDMKSISGKAFGSAEDPVSVLGRVSAISGSGNTASLSVVLKTSGNTITVPAGAVRSHQWNG